MTGYLLDASALLTLIQQEPGSDAVLAVLDRASISSVNLAEVAAKLNERGFEADEVRLVIDQYRVRVFPFEAGHAVVAGLLRQVTRHLGLSLGDRACLATAQIEELAVLTTDQAWRALDAPLGLTIEMLR